MVTRIAHIILALLVFISSTGFVVSRHYCQNELKSVSFFREAEGCHPAKKAMSCPMHAGAAGDSQKEGKKKGCCDDETQYLKADEDKLVQSTTLDLPDFPDILALTCLLSPTDLPAMDAHTVRYLTYKPPIVFQDLPVCLQVFRL